MPTTIEPARSLTRTSLAILATGALIGSITGALAASPVAAASPSTSPQPTTSDHRVVHRDPARDVLAFDVESDNVTPDPADRATDVRRTVVDHRAERLTFTVEVRELRRGGYRLALAEIRTDTGARYWLTVDYSRDPIDQRVTLDKESGGPVTCDGLSWDVDPAADVVSGSVPRSCLEDPRWVRVGVGAVSAPKNVDSSHADDSRRDGKVGEDHLKPGPRQHSAAG